MHDFIIGSTFVITYLITYNCLRRCLRRNDLDEEDYSVEYIHQQNPYSQYISKTMLLQFFSEEENFMRLKKILDLQNGIHDKMVKLVKENQEIHMSYCDAQQTYGSNYFTHTYNIPTIFVINDTKFKSSLGQLNYYRWLILNDYFLYIE